jgi:hypothetical protein
MHECVAGGNGGGIGDGGGMGGGAVGGAGGGDGGVGGRGGKSTWINMSSSCGRRPSNPMNGEGSGLATTAPLLHKGSR